MEASTIKDEMLQFFTQLNSDEQYDEDLYSLTVEQYNIDLEEADAEIEAGNYLTHEEVKRRFVQ